VNLEKRPWYAVGGLMLVISIASGIGSCVSQYLLLPVKAKEEAEKAVIQTRAKGAQLHCEKLQAGATLAAQIEFSADRGYPNTVLLSELIFGTDKDRAPKVPQAEIKAEQLALEKSASELIPFLSEAEAAILNRVTLHHYVVTSLRTSKAAPRQRAVPSEGGFDANQELAGIRESATKLAAVYRAACSNGS
jgi:hypothetical protein